MAGSMRGNNPPEHNIGPSVLSDPVNLSQQFLGYLALRQIREHTYIVETGDTLESIAAKFGDAVADVARVNGLRPPFRVHVGQRLRLP